jgi:hypothetical protein
VCVISARSRDRSAAFAATQQNPPFHLPSCKGKEIGSKKDGAHFLDMRGSRDDPHVICRLKSLHFLLPLGFFQKLFIYLFIYFLLFFLISRLRRPCLQLDLERNWQIFAYFDSNTY